MESDFIDLANYLIGRCNLSKLKEKEKRFHEVSFSGPSTVLLV